MYNFDPYNVLLSIATNIPVLLMTASGDWSDVIKLWNCPSLSLLESGC